MKHLVRSVSLEYTDGPAILNVDCSSGNLSRKAKAIYLSICLSIYLSVYPFVRLSIHPSMRVSINLSTPGVLCVLAVFELEPVTGRASNKRCTTSTSRSCIIVSTGNRLTTSIARRDANPQPPPLRYGEGLSKIAGPLCRKPPKIKGLPIQSPCCEDIK